MFIEKIKANTNSIQIKSGVAFLAILLFSLNVFGQLNFKITHYSTADGLSHNRISCIFKDHEGFMWFGTWNGLNRFDGHNFLVYKSQPGDTSNLQSNRIQEIVEDKAGDLWLRAYDDRIYRFNKKKEEFFRFEVKINASDSSTTFKHIYLTKSGQIWLATPHSGIFQIAKPDAPHLEYKWFNTHAKTGYQLPSNEINNFFEDRSSNLWITTAGGLCILRVTPGGYQTDQNFTNYKIAGITSLRETPERIWLASKTGELFYYDKRTLQIQRLKIASSGINKLVPSSKGNIIYATTKAGDLLLIDRFSLQTTIYHSPQSGGLNRMYEDKSGLLWIEPENSGVLKFDPSNHRFKFFTQETDGDYDNTSHYFRVMEDRSGLTWVSMSKGGFGYYDKAKDVIDYFYNKPGSPTKRFSNIVGFFYKDPSGVLWLGTDDRGINKIVVEKSSFNQQLFVPNSVKRTDNEVRAVATDRYARLWVATRSGGLYVLKSGKRANVQILNYPENGLSSIYKIIEANNGVIWIGTKANGLYAAAPLDHYGNKYQLTRYIADKNTPTAISSNVVYDIVEDRFNRIWLGSYGSGLSLMPGGTGASVTFININGFKHYPKAAFRKIRSMELDNAGRLWIGTTDGLLVSDILSQNVTDTHFKTYRKVIGDPKSLSYNDIQYIYQASDGRMWIGTAGGGLNLAVGADPMQHLDFKAYTTANGLPSDFILSCSEDRKGRLWIATESGLSCLTSANGTAKNFDSIDGLTGNGFSEATALTLTDGRIAFGSLNGLISFDPDKVQPKKEKTRMVFTSLEVNNSEIRPNDGSRILINDINHTDTLRLKHYQNIIAIEYTALDFRSDNQLEYSYRLRNFDDEWHMNKNSRKVIYTNLPPGEYQLEVKCHNGYLFEETPYKALTIIISPPWWKTWWAYLIYLVILLSIAETGRRIAVTMLRLRQRAAVEKRVADLKMTFFTNISHELRTPLTLIINPIEAIYKNEKLSGQATGYIRVIRKNAKRMMFFINQLLELRKVQSGMGTLQPTQVEIVSFVHQIGDYFKEAATEKQIDFKVVANAASRTVWIDHEKIDIVLYNLLSNAFKYSPKHKKITVQLNLTDQDQIQIAVIDEGTGVPEAQLTDIFQLYYEVADQSASSVKGTGIGLSVAKEFIELHQGKIFATNNPTGGLTVTVVLPANANPPDELNVIPANQSIDQPLEERPPVQEAEPASAANHQQQPLVLVVEDSADLRSFLQLQLSRQYRVITAQHGAEGLQLAAEMMPDLIISDIMMPEMDGITMLDRLKKDIKTSHIPVILLSARASIESQIEGLKYGADYYIAKPFNNEFLQEAAANVIARRRQLFGQLLSGENPFKNTSATEPTLTLQDEQFMQKIIQFVNERMIETDFNIEDVAQSLHMSRSSFYRKFSSLSTQAPVEFVREMRLKRAGELLDSGAHTVTEVAFAVGFNSSRYFATCFKEYYKLTPTEYIKRPATKGK
ncbi:two component regulator with propeller domain [Mucilaginibacter yixingensis]|uniref:histidine kinase n=1 Tax=Mucilaginibacter yixingensis TaxID=1295612 RepID=A0A2T5J935_9SPHI|nr:hybrid sensor histidine kinase/response regulator transcription factor [Mucilaginibacter yixingensis]PTQ96593.1 two component regulator with propeller domain [Mucilaginibacter yixingensis]